MVKSVLATLLGALLIGCGGEADDGESAVRPARATATQHAPVPGLKIVSQSGEEVQARVGSTCLPTASGGRCEDKRFPLKDLETLSIAPGERLRMRSSWDIPAGGEDPYTVSLGGPELPTLDLAPALRSPRELEVTIPQAWTGDEQYVFVSLVGPEKAQATFQARLRRQSD